MLATLGGTLALVAGLAVLLLPLLVPELSRPRDAFWGAVVLLLGLVLVTSAERLSGAPMLAVLCGGLLIGRLSTEVSQSRWRQLSEEERLSFWSAARWQTSLNQFGTTVIALGGLLFTRATALGGWLQQRTAAVSASLSSRATTAKPAQTTKRWVRPEPAGAETPTAPAPPAPAADAPEAPLAVVSDFAEVDARVRAALAADQDLPSVTDTVTETDPAPPAPDPADTSATSAAQESAEQARPDTESPAAVAPAPAAEPEADNAPEAERAPEGHPQALEPERQSLDVGSVPELQTPDSGPEAEPEPQAAPEPGLEPEPEPQAEPEPEPQTEPEHEPEPKPDPQIEQEIEPEPEPESHPQTDPESQPQAEASADHNPENTPANPAP